MPNQFMSFGFVRFNPCPHCGAQPALDSERKYARVYAHADNCPFRYDDDDTHVIARRTAWKPWMIGKHLFARKHLKEYVLCGIYARGWEELTTEDTYHEITQRLREYRENEGGTYKIVTRRVANKHYIPGFKAAK